MTPSTPDRYAERLAPDTVRLQRLLPGPVERVWDFLVDPDLRAQWLAGGPLEARTGGAVTLLFRHADLSRDAGDPPPRHADMADGHRQLGTVTACTPPRLLAYTWGEQDGAPSEVRFELSPVGDRVLLTVTHQRLDAAHLTSVAGGWHTHLDIFVARMEGRAPGNFWDAYVPREREYADRLAIHQGASA